MAQETVEVFSVVTIDMKYSMSVSEMSRLTTFDKLSPSMKSVFMQDADLQTVTLIDFISGISREATHRFRTSNNAKSNPEIKGRNSIVFRHDALQVSCHALFTSTPHVFLLNIFINKTERSIHFY